MNLNFGNSVHINITEMIYLNYSNLGGFFMKCLFKNLGNLYEVKE